MKNFEKYKTKNERMDAFEKYCETHSEWFRAPSCAFAWLDLEVEEEKPMPCPYCGSEVGLVKTPDNFWQTICHACCAKSMMHANKEVVVRTHNRMCNAFAGMYESEVK